ncbi:pyridoxine 5'-phosphate synthase [Lysobacter sp. HDW10]|uniref:pyridoxine 5'-phosphate synthase n=1 Tax=Lysobacter sp. HDW10 TaxID=2714936 RepID=UPI00140DFB32|nr:pyridoxine 5'-phosphate synthase [Lysobacter sp. HDW10]QIK80774.1 pyridoxine 5'-phosphate synthase [Lysobacter sp. HDW10]
MTTKLSVNVNKIAVLRNSRGGTLPSAVEAARTCLRAGANGITVHPRPDARHIRSDDVYDLAPICASFGVEFNIEGNPFAPARAGYPGLLALCETVRPAQVTLVPDSDGQLTSDHGFSFEDALEPLAAQVASFKALGARVSVFVNVGNPLVARARDVGADRVELYTGPFAEAFLAGGETLANYLHACAETAQLAQAAGLGVNAGHDLDQVNLTAFLRAVPAVREVSIGHALISEALYDGLETTVANYLAAIKKAAC